MNENIQNALTEVIVSAAETAQDAKQFVEAELPEVVQQLLWWHFTESAIYCAIAFIVVAWPPSYWRFYTRQEWPSPAYGDDMSAEKAIALIFGVLGSIASVITFFYFINIRWLKILIAPKVFLIEYAASLVK